MREEDDRKGENWEVRGEEDGDGGGGDGDDGGAAVRRRRRQRLLEDGSVAMMAEKNRGRGKEWRRSSRRQLDSFPGLP